MRTLMDLSMLAFMIFCLYTVVAGKDDRMAEGQAPKQFENLLAEQTTPDKIPTKIMKTTTAAKQVDEKEVTCLAKNIFFEARGTDENEKIRVINVTTNRTKSRQFHGSYCHVIYDHAQFSWTLDLIRHNVAHFIKHTIENQAWEDARKMARYELAHGYQDTTGGALFYHTHDVNPEWASDGTEKLVMASNYHMYYKPVMTTANTQ